MAQWDNYNLVSHVSRDLGKDLELDSRQFLFFSCVYQELNKRYIKSHENKYYYLYCIVRGPSHLFITRL